MPMCLLLPAVESNMWPHQLCKKFAKESIFNEKYFFSFAYQSSVWLLFGQNPIEIIVDNIFLLDFAQIVTKQLIDKQN